MKERVKRLSSLGLKATYIGKKDCCIDDVTRGLYHFVLGNPELVVGNDKWRGIFLDPEFSQRNILMVYCQLRVSNMKAMNHYLIKYIVNWQMNYK